MQLQGTALESEVALVTNNNPYPSHFSYIVTVIANGKESTALKMESLSDTRDYLTGYGDSSVVVAWFVDTVYRDLIVPNLQTLEVCITKTRVGAYGSTVENKQYDGRVKRYKATVMDATTPDIGDANAQPYDPSNTLKRVTMQLYDRALFELRMQTVSGIYRAATAADTLKTILNAASTKLNLDADVKPIGVEMVPADTQQLANGKLNIREHLVVRSGTPLHDLAGYFQTYLGGIYNNGIGCYYTDRRWYVYPIYDNSRFGQTQRSLTIIRVPTSSMPDVEKSYRLMGEHLLALATGEAIDIDLRDTQQLNGGNALLYGTSKGLFNQPSKDPSGFSSESDSLGKITVNPRPDGLNNIRYDVNTVTDNTALMMSGLATHTQQLFQFGWPYADASLLYPGMPVQICYLKGDIVKRLQGTLISADSFTELAAPGMTTQHWQTKVALTVIASTPPTKRA